MLSPCLGQPALFTPAGELVRLRTKKHLALIVYLAVTAHQEHRRDRLAELLTQGVAGRGSARGPPAGTGTGTGSRLRVLLPLARPPMPDIDHREGRDQDYDQQSLEGAGSAIRGDAKCALDEVHDSTLLQDDQCSLRSGAMTYAGTSISTLLE
jgi:hypothetical protein